MKTLHVKRSLLFLLFFGNLSLNAQETTPKEKIAGFLSRYFQPDRENIHVQFDKTVFFTNESVWFKGYVYNRKTGTPYYTTTNVQMQLIDESGTIISTQLLFAINGLFSGKIPVDKKFASGHYYLQFYTNWMNNFAEDESFVQKIKIINPASPVPALDLPNTATINILFFPEGGNLIAGVPNTVGVSSTDSNGMPLPNLSFDIVDGKNETVKTVTTNSMGMGRFEFTPDGQEYSALLNYNNFKKKYPLPESKPGLALEVNNYVTEGKTMVRIKPSADYLTLLKNKTLYLTLQQDEKSNIMEFTLNPEKTVTELAFSSDYLFKGVNSIRIIDADMNELAERYVFENMMADSSLNMGVGSKNEEKTDLSGNSNIKDACLSIAVVPGNSQLPAESNMLSSLYLHPYLNEKTSARRENFRSMDRNKKFEMDLLMLNQSKNKYDWQNIKSSPPTTKYEFESGIEVKGVINTPAIDLSKYKIEMRNVLNEVLGWAPINEKREFYFRKTNLTDSMMVYCDLIHMDNLGKKDMSYYLSVINKTKPYTKNYVPTPHVYPENAENAAINTEFPAFENDVVYLDEVEIEKKKNALKRQNISGNSYLRGIKVTESFQNTTVLDFIQMNGFYVSNYLGNVIISSKLTTSINAAPHTTPLVFIDGRQLMSFDELNGMRMEELDEIYLSTTAVVASINNNNGIIKMYRKAPVLTGPQTKSKPMLIKGGFEPITSFTNADYLSVYSNGFENFGIINWVPWVITDSNGNMKISIENKKYKKVKVIIEGFTYDGKLVSEVREINLEE